MRFLRENIFMVSLVGVSATLLGIALALNLSWGGDVDARADERVNLSRELDRIWSGPKVSEPIVQMQDHRRETIKKAALSVAELSKAWNKRNYDVIRLPYEGKFTDAFPIDEQRKELYSKYLLSYVFTQEYRKTMLSMLSDMSPASLPTKAEIDAEAVQQERLIRRERLIGDKAATSAPAAPGFGAPTEGAGATDIAKEAQDRATRVLMVRRANSGTMYVSEESLDVAFPVPVTNVPNATLWEAQVNLWTQKDILAVIKATNEEAARGRSEPLTVLTAPVKRLVKVQVGAKGAGQPVVAAEGSGAPAAGGAGAVVRAGSLTGRVTCPDYDVVRYSFVVVMPARHLPALEYNLMKQNYHAVLLVEMGPVPQEEKDLFYYGTDPVMEVTVQGELLLLASWARPLMPR